MGSILCEHCVAACCRYLALPIDKPTTKRDFDDIRWYLMHEDVTVFVEDGDWYIQYQARCKNLAADNLCKIYATRPQICEEYKANGCDYQGGEYGYDQFFTHAKQIEDFYRQKKGLDLGAREQPTAKKRRKKGSRKKSA